MTCNFYAFTRDFWLGLKDLQCYEYVILKCCAGGEFLDTTTAKYQTKMCPSKCVVVSASLLTEKHKLGLTPNLEGKIDNFSVENYHFRMLILGSFLGTFIYARLEMHKGRLKYLNLSLASSKASAHQSFPLSYRNGTDFTLTPALSVSLLARRLFVGVLAAIEGEPNWAEPEMLI